MARIGAVASLMFCVYLSAGAMQQRLPIDAAGAARADFPKDIYEAIKKGDQAAIDYYIAAGQAHLGEHVQTRGHVEAHDWLGLSIYGCEEPMLFGEDVHSTHFYSCYLLGVPLRRHHGMTVETPLYAALERRNILAARRLVMGAGARLNAGKWRNKFSSAWSWSADRQSLSLTSAAELLARNARRYAEARDLLRDAIAQDKPLLSGRQETDDKVCDELICIGDQALLQQAVEHHVVHPGQLLCVALEHRRQVEIDTAHAGNPSDELWDRMCAAVGKFGERRLVDMLLMRRRPEDFERILEQIVISGDTELVTYLLARRPDAALVRRVMPRARNRVVAQQLFEYNAALAEAIATGCYADATDDALVPAPVAPVPAPQPGPDAVSVHDVAIAAPAPQASAVRIVADDCPVCSYPLNTRSFIRTLPCGHNFHGECVSKWIAEHHTCPTCRAPVA